MAVTVSGLPVRGSGIEASVCPAVETKRLHRITSKAGHALEILGHAIEYLADEYLQDAEELSVHDPHVQAVQILMQLNREIYYACPLQPTFAERLRGIFGFTSR